MRLGEQTVPVVPEWVDAPPAVDGRPKGFGLLRRLWPWVRAVVTVVWIWAFLLGPLAAVIYAAGYLTPNTVAAIVAGFLIAGLLAGVWRPKVVRAVDRTRVALFRVWWASICQLCGFVAIANRRVRIPRLVNVEFGPGLRTPEWTRITLEPLLTHEPPTWPRYEERLARYLRAGSSTWTTTDTPGQLTISLRTEPLPHRWVHGIDVGADRYGTVEPAADGMPEADVVYLGASASGGDVVWRPDESGRGNLAIGGGTGGGKNGALANVLAHGLHAPRPWRLFIANPKGTGDYRWLDGHASVAKTPAGMFTMISFFRAELDRRADILDDFGAASYLDVPLADLEAQGMGERWLLVIDEFVSFASKKGVVMAAPPGGKGRQVDLLAVALSELQETTSMARALLMNHVFMWQHPITEHLGPFGSTMRSNFGARAGVGSLEAEGAASLFGKPNGEPVAHVLRSGIPGRIVHQGLSLADGPNWGLGQVRWIPPTDLPTLTPTQTGWEPPDFDDLAHHDLLLIDRRAA
jgi:hypothetical protein